MKKVALIGTVCSGVAVVGAGVGITAALLLNNGSTLADLSDQDALKQGFESLMKADANDCAKVMENLSGKDFTIYTDLDINNIANYEELNNSSFSASADVDIENKMALFSAACTIDSTDFDFNILLKDTGIALKSNLFDDIYYIDANDLYDELNIEAISEDTLDSFESLCADYSFSDEYKNGLKEVIQESIDTLVDNMDIERSDDTEEIGDVTATKFECTVYTEDIFNAYFSVIEYVLNSEEFKDIYTKQMESMSLDNVDDVNASYDDMLNQLNDAKSEILDDITTDLGESFDFSAYLTDDVELVRLSTKVGEDDLLLNVVIDITEDGYEFTISDDNDTSIKVTCKANDSEFAFSLLVKKKGTELFRGALEGAYTVTDTSVEIDIDTCQVTAVALNIFDISAKFGIKELTDDIEDFEGNYVSFDEFDPECFEQLEELFN